MWKTLQSHVALHHLNCARVAGHAWYGYNKACTRGINAAIGDTAMSVRYGRTPEETAKKHYIHTGAAYDPFN